MSDDGGDGLGRGVMVVMIVVMMVVVVTEVMWRMIAVVMTVMMSMVIFGFIICLYCYAPCFVILHKRRYVDKV